jgi:hypothetical protein
MAERKVRDELLRFERALASRDPTGIDGGLTSLIAPDFVEFGQSGRVWTALSVRELLEGHRADRVSIENFEIAQLAEGVILATYVTPGPTSVNRSSIWIRREGRWLIRFHQGTRQGA